MLAIIFFIIIPLVLFFYFKYNIGSIIVILSLLFIFYYTPYSFYLEPSFWQFRRICKLNELPNDEEKYNKILAYFDTSLDKLDWEGIEKKSILLTQDYLEYSSQNDRYMYRYEDKSDTRIKKVVFLFFNDSIKLGNLYKIDFEAFWHNGKKYLERESIGSYRFEWRKSYETCSLFGKD